MENSANLPTTTQSDREAFIALMSMNAKLTRQLIDVNLKLTKAYTEVLRLKSLGSERFLAHIPAAFDLTTYSWYRRYKIRVGYSSRTCMTKKEEHKVDATCANITGVKEFNNNWTACWTLTCK